MGALARATESLHASADALTAASKSLRVGLAEQQGEEHLGRAVPGHVRDRDGDAVLVFFAIAEEAQVRVLDMQG